MRREEPRLVREGGGDVGVRLANSSLTCAVHLLSPRSHVRHPAAASRPLCRPAVPPAHAHATRPPPRVPVVFQGIWHASPNRASATHHCFSHTRCSGVGCPATGLPPGLSFRGQQQPMYSHRHRHQWQRKQGGWCSRLQQWEQFFSPSPRSPVCACPTSSRPPCLAPPAPAWHGLCAAGTAALRRERLDGHPSGTPGFRWAS